MAKDRADAGLNKMKAVREVLQEKGNDTPPLEIQSLIKEKHGVELPTSLISSYKFKLIGSVRKKGRKRGRKRAAAVAGETANGRRAPTGGEVSIEDIAQVKKLVESMGAEKVRQLAKVLAK